MNAVLVLVLLLTTRAIAVDIAACGAVVSAGDTGVLVADLDCTATTQRYCTAACAAQGLCGGFIDQPCTVNEDCAHGPCAVVGVALERGARLDLAGFSIVDAPGDDPSYGVMCNVNGACTVTGPGTVDGFSFGVWGERIRVFDLLVSNGLEGVFGQRVVGGNLTATGHAWYGINGGVVRGLGPLHATDNVGYGIFALRLSAREGVTALGNGLDGVHAGFNGRSRLVARNFVVQNNAGAGIVADGGLLLIDSTVTGNNGGGAGIDVASLRPPGLRGTVTCGKSSMLSDEGFFGPPWGVCTND